MKTIKFLVIALITSISISQFCNAQHGQLTVRIKGIKEVKGKIMIAFGDQSHPKEMAYGMQPVISKDDIIYEFKDLQNGYGNLYIYQDLNENKQLDKDEKQVPTEPCYSKEKITIKDANTTVEIRLINVKEMMENN